MVAKPSAEPPQSKPRKPYGSTKQNLPAAPVPIAGLAALDKRARCKFFDVTRKRGSRAGTVKANRYRRFSASNPAERVGNS